MPPLVVWTVAGAATPWSSIDAVRVARVEPDAGRQLDRVLDLVAVAARRLRRARLDQHAIGRRLRVDLDLLQQLARGLVGRRARDPLGLDFDRPAGRGGLDDDAAVDVLDLEPAVGGHRPGLRPRVGGAARRETHVEVAVADVDVAPGRGPGRCDDGARHERDT